MDKIELLLNKYLRDKNLLTRGQERGVVPDAEDFALYCQDRLEGEALERMRGYLVANRWAQDMVLEMKRAMEEEILENEIPAGLAKKAKGLMKGSAQTALCPHCGKAITPFKRPIARQKWINLFWLLMMAGSFALSFVFPRYFMQFLAVTVLAGVQWAVEMRASKTQIMIYRALSDGEKHEHRLREFQEKESLKNRDGGI